MLFKPYCMCGQMASGKCTTFMLIRRHRFNLLPISSCIPCNIINLIVFYIESIMFNGGFIWFASLRFGLVEFLRWLNVCLQSSFYNIMQLTENNLFVFAAVFRLFSLPTCPLSRSLSPHPIRRTMERQRLWVMCKLR